MAKRPKRPRDPNQLGKLIVDLASGQVEDQESEADMRNPAAVQLGKLGGAKGGKARAAKLSKKRRSEISRRAARARWSKTKT
jgi:hypothetical protein